MKREGRENERKIGYAIRMQNTAFTRRFLQDGLADGLDEVTIMHGWIMGYLLNYGGAYNGRTED